MKEFKSKPLIGLEDLSDNKFSIRAEQAILNGKSDASKAASKIQGAINAKNKFWEKATFEQRSKGGKTSGKNNVKNGHLKSVAHLGGKTSALINIKEKENNLNNIFSKLNDTFTSKEMQNVCIELGLNGGYHKRVLRTRLQCEMIYEGNNQFNPSIYKKLKKDLDM